MTEITRSTHVGDYNVTALAGEGAPYLGFAPVAYDSFDAVVKSDKRLEGAVLMIVADDDGTLPNGVPYHAGMAMCVYETNRLLRAKSPGGSLNWETLLSDLGVDYTIYVWSVPASVSLPALEREDIVNQDYQATKRKHLKQFLMLHYLPLLTDTGNRKTGNDAAIKQISQEIKDLQAKLEKLI